ncbi:MAG TPA: DUF4097 family beta strand repeat-containing protein, partial [Clostridia bacterium]|nr:DUF4097 family beta strand repeat-containing protein [Clostridia bacterium]
MERNIRYPADQVRELRVRLAWAYLDILSDEIDEVQILVAGDDATVEELTIGLEDGVLTLDQPQFGISLNSLHAGQWLQVCLRLPRELSGTLEAGTISGALCARTLTADVLSLETVSGALHVQRLTAREELTLRTVSGAIAGSALRAPKAHVRTISGMIRANDLDLPYLRASTVSGKVSLHYHAPIESLDLQSISGSLEVAQPSDSVHVGLHSLSGKLTLQGVQTLEGERGPTISATTAT